MEEAPAAAAAEEAPTAAVKTAAVEARAAASQLLTDVEAFRGGQSDSYRSIFAETVGGPKRTPLARPQPPAPQPPAPQAEAVPAANPPSRARQALYENRHAALHQHQDPESFRERRSPYQSIFSPPPMGSRPRGAVATNAVPAAASGTVTPTPAVPTAATPTPEPETSRPRRAVATNAVPAAATGTVPPTPAVPTAATPTPEPETSSVEGMDAVAKWLEEDIGLEAVDAMTCAHLLFAEGCRSKEDVSLLAECGELPTDIPKKMRQKVMKKAKVPS